MSKFHQYIELQDNVYKRYVKTQIGVLSGRRADPHDVSKTVPYVLSTPDEYIKYRVVPYDGQDTYEVDGHTPEISYDDEVLETYHADDDKIFRTLNRKLMSEGLIVEYTGAQNTVDLTNALTDIDIAELAQTKNLLAFKKQLKQITSHVTLDRIVLAAIEKDRPNSFLRAIKERKDELSTN